MAESAGRSAGAASQASGQSQTPQGLGFNAAQASQRSVQPSAQSIPKGASPVLTTEKIQKLLEENHSLIRAILESNSQGKTQECQRYHHRLQQNLMYLAAVADSQPQAPVQQPLMQIRPQQAPMSALPPPSATPVASTPSTTTPSITPQITPQLSPAATPTPVQQSLSTTPSPSPPPTPHATRPSVHTLTQHGRNGNPLMTPSGGVGSSQVPPGSAQTMEAPQPSVLQTGGRSLPQVVGEDMQPTRKQKTGEGLGDVVAKWGGT